jgi:hypothetical protein
MPNRYLNVKCKKVLPKRPSFDIKLVTKKCCQIFKGYFVKLALDFYVFSYFLDSKAWPTSTVAFFGLPDPDLITFKATTRPMDYPILQKSQK